MARIVICCWGSHGDVDPSLGLATGLRARGHSVGIATLEYFRPVVTAAGCDFFPLRPHADPSDTATVHRIMHASRGPEILLKEIVFPAVRAQYADVEAAAQGADLLISHPLSIAVPIFAERHAVPWANMVLAPTSFFSPTDMPVLPPAPWLKQLEVLGGWLPRLLVAGGKASTHRWAAAVTDFRRSLGMSDGKVPLFDGQHSPSLVLAMYSRVMGEPQPDWPPNVVVTGYMFHDLVHGATLDAAVQQFIDAGPAPLVFTLGSSAVLSPGAFWQESITAVEALGARAVFLVGPGNAAAMQARLPSQILAVDRAPHSLLFPHAAAIVQQCGAGTMGQVLRSGRPTLAVPFAHDQPDNAYRAARLGVARIVPARRYRARRVAQALGALVADPSYVTAAREVASRVRAERGVDAACDAIEQTWFTTRTTTRTG
jgi:UDP:flavonoid glycosyltransferase YjiC (YdhE family)